MLSHKTRFAILINATESTPPHAEPPLLDANTRTDPGTSGDKLSHNSRLTTRYTCWMIFTTRNQTSLRQRAPTRDPESLKLRLTQGSHDGNADLRPTERVHYYSSISSNRSQAA